MRIDRSTSLPLDPFKTNNSSCCTTKTIMMSSPVCLGFSGPVMSVLIVGNPMTMKDCIDATRKSCAERVGRKTAPISCMPTPDTSKPLNVASRVIGTFLETCVSNCMLARTTLANPSPTPSPLCALNDADVLPVINKI